MQCKKEGDCVYFDSSKTISISIPFSARLIGVFDFCLQHAAEGRLLDTASVAASSNWRASLQLLWRDDGASTQGNKTQFRESICLIKSVAARWQENFYPLYKISEVHPRGGERIELCFPMLLSYTPMLKKCWQVFHQWLSTSFKTFSFLGSRSITKVLGLWRKCWHTPNTREICKPFSDSWPQPSCRC